LTQGVRGGEEMVRKVPPSWRSVTGYYNSLDGRVQQSESLLENHAGLLLDFESSIKSIVAQPVLLGLYRVPDFKIETTDGSLCIIDVKPEAKLVGDFAKLGPILLDTNNYCKSNGLTYLIFTDYSRNELRNRIDVLKEVTYRALASDLGPELETKLETESLSLMKNETSISVKALCKKICSGIDYSKKQDVICKLICDHSLTVLDTPTSWIADAIVGMIPSQEVKLPDYLFSYERLVRRIDTHPLRFMTELDPVDYYEGKKEIKLEGHVYAIIDATRLEHVLIRSVESVEEYRVSLDTYETPDAKISAYALQEKNSESYFRFIRRVEIIAGLAHFEKIPPESRAQAMKLLGIGERQLERLVAEYRRNQSSGLLPSDSRGGKGRHRLNEKVEEIISDTIEEHYLTARSPTVASVYNKVLTAIDQANKVLATEQRLTAPDAKTLYSRIKERDTFDKIQKRRGSREAENRVAVFGNKFDEGKFPLELVMVDNADLDIILVDNETRNPVGRPFLTAMGDTYSHCIPAFHLGPKQPTANEVGITILKCALDKSSDVQKYGISEWPVHGIPSALHFDNAKEFRSNLILAGCAAWRIKVLHRPVMNPRFAGMIERLIKTFQQEIHDLAGTTKSNPVERGIYNSEGNACLTIEELEDLLVHFLDKYHHTPQPELNGMTPIEKFRQGIAEHGTPRQLAPEDKGKFRISFLPAAMRTIQKGGIKHEGLTFYSPRLTTSRFPREDTQGKSINYLIRFDPFDIRYILIMDPKTKEYVLVPSNKTFSEPVVLRSWEIARRKLRERGIRDPTATILFETYKRTLIKNASLSTKSARKEAEITRRQSDIAEKFSVSKTKEVTEESQPEKKEEFEPTPIDPSTIYTHFKKPQEQT
jgi:putative transposase